MSIRRSLQALAAALFLSALAPVSFAQAAPDGAYTVKPGDVLTISVWKEPELQGDVLVRPDGGFSFPLAGEVDARNRSVAQIQQTVVERLGRYISDPVVSVTVKEIKGNKIYVIGQVNKPGEFIINPTVDVMQALSMAGGTTAFASLTNITILRRAGNVRSSLRFDYTEVVKGRALEQNIELKAGDTVVVP